MNSPGMSVIRFMLEAPALRAPNNRAEARVPRGWLCPMTAMAIPLKPVSCGHAGYVITLDAHDSQRRLSARAPEMNMAASRFLLCC